MAHSLEVREPLMDHTLIEWAARLPQSLKIGGNETKLVLKKSMESALPHEVLYRSKMGFAVPLAEWFRGPLAGKISSAFASGRLADSGFFDGAKLQALARDHVNGSRDSSAALWALMNLDGFLAKES